MKSIKLILIISVVAAGCVTTPTIPTLTASSPASPEGKEGKVDTFTILIVEKFDRDGKAEGKSKENASSTSHDMESMQGMDHMNMKMEDK